MPGTAPPCPFCGAAVPRGHRVCKACGNGYLLPCGGCGHQGAAVAFCQQCGDPLGSLGTRKQGAYRLVRLLGKGGMGQTFHAVDPGGRHVAVKELLAQTADKAKVRELFAREAMALGALDHPAIPRLIEFFVEGGRRVQVMDLIHGTSLDRLAMEAGGRLPEHRVVRWMMELCDILEYLHGRRVIHRDIKPGNLLLRRSPPALVLIDFGAVKEAGAPPGTVIATPGYAPFEQSQGSPVPQSDLYSVGCTIIALVTGQNPATLYDTAKGTFMDLEKRGMSPALSRIVREATAFIAAERPPSARTLKRALAAV
ncbi:MAG: protein kinase [Candidatus Sericytochromatia bacterium]|nr:protein kinase [Candidatus Tanganyikabacteria bacterium]